MHLTKQKSGVRYIFCEKSIAKRQTEESVKKVLKKIQNYGILYVKLGADLGDPLRRLADP